MDWTGTGAKATPDDFARAAAHVGCPVAALQAVVLVEAGGGGFDSRARLKILPEPHIFWRNLGGSQRRTAEAAQLAAPAWGDIPYDATQDARYDRLKRMMEIEERAALESCSWGLPQIMGGNAILSGFASVWDMIDRFKLGEAAQLLGLAGFIIGAGLASALARLDWTAFAKGYNGPLYSRNAYDRRLASAYAKLAMARPADADPLADGILARGDTGYAVKELQLKLSAAGFSTGGNDGAFGAITEQAVRQFQRAWHFSTDGKVGPVTGAALGLSWAA